ncbi:MAG: nitroreductase [Clostridia bacterium]|nr:nitroreductase [Clostridia bacterium]
MVFLDLVRQRYSVREFCGRPVEEEKLALVLEAGRLAPTAKNFQPQHILVLRGEQTALAAKASPCTYGAPVVLVVCYDRDNVTQIALNQVNFGYVDTACVITHMMLQATELGLGTCWVGRFDEQALKDTFSLPERYVPAALLPIGYPAETSQPSERHDLRKPLGEIVEFWCESKAKSK